MAIFGSHATKISSLAGGSNNLSQRYQDMINANPYRGLEYTQSPIQKLLHWLGFRTEADAWKENMAVQANEYDAGIIQKAYDEDYNDALSQVQRLKSAGLNPDLDPSSVSSGEAGTIQDDASVPMQSTGQEGQFKSFVTGLFDAFNEIVGMTSGIQGIVRNNIQNSILSSEAESAFANNAIGISSIFLPNSPHPQGIDNFDWRYEANKNMDEYVSKHYRKAKDRQKFKDVINSYWDSAIGESESYEDFKNRISSRKDYEMEYRVNWSELDDALMMITEPLARNAEDIFRLQQEVAKIQLEYQKDYTGALDPDIQATATNTSAEYEAQYSGALDASVQAGSQNAVAGASAKQAELNNLLSKTQSEIISNLVERSKQKGIKGWYARWLLQRSMLRSIGGVDQFQDFINGVNSIPGL